MGKPGAAAVLFGPRTHARRKRLPLAFVGLGLAWALTAGRKGRSDAKAARLRTQPKEGAGARDTATSSTESRTQRESTAGAERAAANDHGRAAEKPRDIPRRGWRDVLGRTKDEIKADNLSIVAAGVAFYIFLGIIPALAAVVSIYGLVANPDTIKAQIDAMSGMLAPDVIQILDQQMTRIAQQSSQAGWGAAIGILLALWAGSKATKAVMTGLNVTYGEAETRGFLKLNLTALGLTLAGVVGVIVAVALVVVIPIILGFVGLGDAASTLVSILRWPLLAIFAMLGLAALYRYAPNREAARWHWVSWGAALATAIWLIASAGFSYYVSNFGSYGKTYGSLAGIVVLLMWFLISAYALLLGAELNAEMEHQTARDTTTGPARPLGERGATMADEVGREYGKG